MKKKPGIADPLPSRRMDLRRNRFDMLSQWYGKERASNEIAAHTCQPRRIDQLLNEVLQTVQRPENGALIRLRSEWSKIIGKNFSRFCEPHSLRDGVLTLTVRHSALLVELKPSCDLICRQINQVLGEELCREVRLTT